MQTDRGKPGHPPPAKRPHMDAQEYVRNCLQGFIHDPPDTEFQQGFRAAFLVIAEEAFGIEWSDPQILLARAAGNADDEKLAKELSAQKRRAAFKIVE